METSKAEKRSESAKVRKAAVPLVATRGWLHQRVSPQLYSRNKLVYSLLQKRFWFLSILSNMVTTVKCVNSVIAH